MIGLPELLPCFPDNAQGHTSNECVVRFPLVSFRRPAPVEVEKGGAQKGGKSAVTAINQISVTADQGELRPSPSASMSTLRPASKVFAGNCCIHFIAHDYYGNRLATCSSDKKIRVFDKGEDDQWQLSSEWSAHKSTIWQVDWAHPEFGQVLASCSDDRTVVIWSEKGEGTAGQQEVKFKFQPMATLSDFGKGVTCVRFAPSHLGLQLASASNDGKVRLHHGSATNLNVWSLGSELEPDGPGFGANVTCVSWDKSRLDAPMLVVGWSRAGEPRVSSVAIWGLSAEKKQWVVALRLEVEADKKGAVPEVRDVDWAPPMGRPHHLIAAALGSSVQVWRVGALAGWEERRVEPAERLAVLEAEPPGASVARAAWNLSGTALAIANDNAQVKMWKLDFTGQLKPHATLDPQH